MDSTSTEELEELLREHAREGWKVISSSAINVNMLGIGGGEKQLIVLEREMANQSPCQSTYGRF